LPRFKRTPLCDPPVANTGARVVLATVGGRLRPNATVANAPSRDGSQGERRGV